jgi:hypothetical protein
MFGNDFGWDLPPGCSHDDIDEAVGANSKTQWQDETLVANFANANNKFEVWELPARQLSVVSMRGRIFHRVERAEAYIAREFDASGVLIVSPDDILEEMKRREQAAK